MMVFFTQDQIDKKTLEILPEEDGTVYSKMAELGDELPDHAPRFVLLSYPLTLVRGTPREAVRVTGCG